MKRLKYLFAGAGAVGAYLGARMALAGEDVTLFARGPHLRAMQQHGVRILRREGGDCVARPRIIESLADAGDVDVIFLCVKAHSLTQLVPQMAPLIRTNTTVVSTENGLPWWYFQLNQPQFADIHLEKTDPGGAVGAAIDPHSIVGSLIYFATEIAEPGVIRHNAGNRISLGEPDGTRSERSLMISTALTGAGFKAPVTTHIRTEIWVKILGNIAFNPISALTRATIVQMTTDPDVVALVRTLMTEVEALAAKLGIEMPISIDKRIAGAEKMGEHKTSMLQDLEAGRPLELEPVVGAVLELADRLGVRMPHTRVIYACTRLLERTVSKARR